MIIMYIIMFRNLGARVILHGEGTSLPPTQVPKEELGCKLEERKKKKGRKEKGKKK